MLGLVIAPCNSCEASPVIRPLELLPGTSREAQLVGLSNCCRNVVIRPLKLLSETPAKQAQLLGLLNCSLEPRKKGSVIGPVKCLKLFAPLTPAS